MNKKFFIKKAIVRFENENSAVNCAAYYKTIFQNTKLAVSKCEIAHNNAPLIVSKSIEKKVI